MSSRAHRLVAAAAVQSFEWVDAAGAPEPALWGEAGAAALRRHDPRAEPRLSLVGNPPEPAPPVEAEMPTPAEQQAHLAALERDAFAKGYAQGERAGIEAGAQRADAMLRRMAQTIDELAALRTRMLRETERQMVQLALTLARRIVHRELTLDPDLVGAMAHVALDRLGDSSPATIRLHPDDYATVTAARTAEWTGTQVSVVPDASIARGGCLVESAFGLVDASVTSQLAELERALLGDAEGLSGDGGRDAA